jgi:hypothetical protein
MEEKMNIVILNPKFMGDVLTSSFICPLLKRKYKNSKITLLYTENEYKNSFEPFSILKNFPENKYYDFIFILKDALFEELYDYRSQQVNRSIINQNTWSINDSPVLSIAIEEILKFKPDLIFNLHQHYSSEYGLAEKDLLFSNFKLKKIRPLILYINNKIANQIKIETNNEKFITISDRIANHLELKNKIENKFKINVVILSEQMETLEKRLGYVQLSDICITCPCIDETFTWASPNTKKIGIYSIFHKNYKFSFNNYIKDKVIFYEGLKEKGNTKILSHTFIKIIKQLEQWIN